MNASRKGAESLSDRVFLALVRIALGCVLLLTVYPLYVVVISSISDPRQVVLGNVALAPKGITFEGYEVIFGYAQLWVSYRNSILYTVGGTALNILCTMTAAYALSRSFRGKKLTNLFFVFTMFFSGGLIPTFLTLRDIGLYNNPLIMFLEGLVSIWNLMVARTYITSSIPNELFEAASLDGASHFQYFRAVVMPLSGTIIAVLCVYYGVNHWNDYFTGLVYLRDRSLLPLQTILREILASLQTNNEILEIALDDVHDRVQGMMKAEIAKYGIIVVSTAPVVLLYICMQKYFVKGVMIGSLKG